jgi:transglutaminase-like putative cysteine protease
VKIATLPSFGASLLAVAIARAALRIVPARTIRWAASRVSRTVESRSVPASIAPMAWGVAAAGALLRASCLEQSVALTGMLALTRIPARLVIGVSRSGRTLDAHAWVESHGSIVLGAPEAPSYAALPTAAG